MMDVGTVDSMEVDSEIDQVDERKMVGVETESVMFFTVCLVVQHLPDSCR